MKIHEDTYFLNYDEALKTAKQQNMINEYDLQVCYYDGVKRDHNIKNLIHLPFESLNTELIIINERTPTQINTDGLNLSNDVKSEIANSFNILLDTIEQNKNKIGHQLISQIKQSTINFKEPLRIFLYSNKTTKVMKNIASNIASTFREKGYDVWYEYDNELQDMTIFRVIKAISTYNPHIFIDINKNHSKYLNDNTFNFMWYQDPTPDLVNQKLPPPRKRDFIFSLVGTIDTLLDKHNLPYERQSFCINTDIFNSKENITRENKIIFIGSSYYERLTKSGLSDDQLNHLKELFYSGFDFNDHAISTLADEFNFDKSYFEFHIIGSLVRYFSVIELCKLSDNIKIEIYGYEWENIPEVQPFYKGTLKYEELPDVYSSAKYILAPHSHYILQQRVLEASACGAIPIVYDCRSVDQPPFYLDSVLLYKNIKDLKNLINADVNNLKEIIQKNSYNAFADKILSIVNTQLME